MFGIGPWELILILVIALVVFGPGKLPEVGQAMGKGLKEFRKATEGVKESIQKEVGEDMAAVRVSERENRNVIEKL